VSMRHMWALPAGPYAVFLFGWGLTRPGKLWHFKLAKITFTSLTHVVFSVSNVKVHKRFGGGGA
jgi:hypothetical protein